MNQLYCETCNDFITPVIHVRKEKIVFKEEEFVIDAKSSVCPVCEHEFITAESHDENLRVLQGLYCQRKRRLTAQQIMALRSRYAPNQVSFARVLGVGDKTITRYENGYVPDESINNLLLLMELPENFKRLYEKNASRLTSDERKEIDRRLRSLMQDEQIENCVIVHTNISWDPKLRVAKTTLALRESDYIEEEAITYAS